MLRYMMYIHRVPGRNINYVRFSFFKPGDYFSNTYIEVLIIYVCDNTSYSNKMSAESTMSRDFGIMLIK